MTIKTKSKFYYGHEITLLNPNLPFDEGGPELNAVLNVGTYSLTGFAVEVERALNEAGGQLYTVTVDRDTRQLTISSAVNFSLLFATGATIGSAATSLLGYDNLDYTGSNSYQAPNASGSEYVPQFFLQDYSDFLDNEEGIQTSVNESASGVVEAVSYGRKSVMECNIMFITNIRQLGCAVVVEDNATGIEDARDFLGYIINKGNIEFIPDRSDASTFTTVLLESTPESRDGTAFKLKEMSNRGLFEYFESGLLTFRKVE